MNGDNPAVEFEDGTQKGGHFGCSGCSGRDGPMNMTTWLTKSTEALKKNELWYCKESLESLTPHFPFKSLKVEQIREQLKSRGGRGGWIPVATERNSKKD